MQRSQRVALGRQPQFPQRVRPLASEAGELQRGIEHHVADHMHARRNALPRELLCRTRGGAEEQVRTVVGEHAVVLLGHGAVEAAEPGLDVRHAHPQLGRRECARQRGIGVAVDQGPVRPLRLKHLFDPDQHLPGLPAVPARPDAQRIVRLGDGELLEEAMGHLRVIVLPRVDQDLRVAGPWGAQDATHGRSLDELRSGADDCNDLHNITCGVLRYAKNPYGQRRPSRHRTPAWAQTPRLRSNAPRRGLTMRQSARLVRFSGRCQVAR